MQHLIERLYVRCGIEEGPDACVERIPFLLYHEHILRVHPQHEFAQMLGPVVQATRHLDG